MRWRFKNSSYLGSRSPVARTNVVYGSWVALKGCIAFSSLWPIRAVIRSHIHELGSRRAWPMPWNFAACSRWSSYQEKKKQPSIKAKYWLFTLLTWLRGSKLYELQRGHSTDIVSCVQYLRGGERLLQRLRSHPSFTSANNCRFGPSENVVWGLHM